MTASIILGIIAILMCLCGLFCTDKKGYINLQDPYYMNSFDDINEYLTKYTKYIGKLQDKIKKLKVYIK